AVWSEAPSDLCVYTIAPAARRLQRSFVQGRVLAVALSHDGSRLGVVVEHLGVLVLDTASDAVVKVFEADVRTAGYGFMEFSPDGRMLVCGATGSETTNWLSLYDLAGDLPVRSIDEAVAGAISPSSRLLASGTFEGIRIRDASTFEVRSVIHGQFRQ